MPQATAPVPLVLLLTVALGCLRVGLPVLLLIAGMLVAPLFPAEQRGIGVEGIGTNLVAMIFTAATTLASRVESRERATESKGFNAWVAATLRFHLVATPATFMRFRGP